MAWSTRRAASVSAAFLLPATAAALFCPAITSRQAHTSLTQEAKNDGLGGNEGVRCKVRGFRAAAGVQVEGVRVGSRIEGVRGGGCVYLITLSAGPLLLHGTEAAVRRQPRGIRTGVVHWYSQCGSRLRQTQPLLERVLVHVPGRVKMGGALMGNRASEGGYKKMGGGLG